jgi:hypothetical protein
MLVCSFLSDVDHLLCVRFTLQEPRNCVMVSKAQFGGQGADAVT